MFIKTSELFTYMVYTIRNNNNNNNDGKTKCIVDTLHPLGYIVLTQTTAVNCG